MDRIALLLVGIVFLMSDFDKKIYNNGQLGKGTSTKALIEIGSLIVIVLFIAFIINVSKVILSAFNPNKIRFEEAYFIIPKGRNNVRKINYIDS